MATIEKDHALNTGRQNRPPAAEATRDASKIAKESPQRTHAFQVPDVSQTENNENKQARFTLFVCSTARNQLIHKLSSGEATHRFAGCWPWLHRAVPIPDPQGSSLTHKQGVPLQCSWTVHTSRSLVFLRSEYRFGPFRRQLAKVYFSVSRLAWLYWEAPRYRAAQASL